MWVMVSSLLVKINQDKDEVLLQHERVKVDKVNFLQMGVIKII